MPLVNSLNPRRRSKTSGIIDTTVKVNDEDTENEGDDGEEHHDTLNTTSTHGEKSAGATTHGAGNNAQEEKATTHGE